MKIYRDINMETKIKKEEKRMRKEEQGITLIALIITLIILVILAAVSIRAVYNMGIVGRAVNGAQDYAREAKREEEIMDKTTKLMKKTINKINGGKTYIEYVLNGGTNSEGQITEFNIGETVRLLNATKEGAYFDGWYESRDFSTKRINSTGDIEDDITLYAKWIEETQVNYFSWSTTSTDATIIGFSETGLRAYNDGNITTLAIPQYYNNLTVTQVSGNAFSDKDKITKLVIPDCITKIEATCFKNCSNLKEITIPISLKVKNAINTESAFVGCTNVEEIYFSKGTGIGVDYTDDYYSQNIYKATPWYLSSEAGKEITVTFENGIEKIGSYMFYNCTRLNVSNWDAIKSISTFGAHAFDNCINLNVLIKKDSFRSNLSIGTAAFRNCSGISGELELKDGTIGEASFEGCTGLTKVSINIDNFTIPTNAFSGCSGIVTLIVGDNIKKLDVACFKNCSSIKNLTIPISLKVKNAINTESAFVGCTNVEEIYFSKGTGIGVDYTDDYYSQNIYKATPWYLSSAADKKIVVTIDEGIEKIGNFAFYNCSGIYKINFKSNEFTSLNKLKSNLIYNGISSGINALVGTGLTSDTEPIVCVTKDRGWLCDSNGIIETGITLSGNYKIETKIKMNSFPSSYNNIWGTGNSSFESWIPNSGKQLCFRSNSEKFTSSNTMSTGEIYTIIEEVKDGTLTADVKTENGESENWITGTVSSGSSSSTLKLFATTSNSCATNMTMYYFKIYKEEALVLDLIPVIYGDKVDGAIMNQSGFYDKISKTFK